MRNRELLIAFAVIVIVLPWVMQGSSLFGFMVLAGIYAIAAMGVDLVFGYGGQITLGHGAFLAIGAYSSSILTLRYGFPPILALVVGAIVASIIAFLIGAPVLGLLTHFHLAMATLAFGVLVYNFLVVGGEFTGGFSGIAGIPRFSIGPFNFVDDMSYYYLVWGFAFVFLVVGLNIGNSQAGRLLRAIQSDETAAEAAGVDIGAYKLKVFLLSAVYSSVAGSLMAHFMMYVSPTQFDVTTSFDLITMSVLGGRGTIIGGVLGAVFLKLLPQFTEFFRDYRLLSNGILVTAVLLLTPGGITGLLRSLLRQVEKLVTERTARDKRPALVAREGED